MHQLSLPFLNWPLAILILGVTAIFVFKPEIKRLIDRAQEIRAPGVGIQAGTHQGDSESAKGSNPSAAADELRKVFDNQLVVSRTDHIMKDLVKRGLSAQEREFSHPPCLETITRLAV